MTRARSRLVRFLGCGLAAAFIAGCGGGDGTPAPAPTPTTTALSGSVVKGPVNGAQVCAYKAISTGKGEQLGCTTTNSTGGYTLSLTYVGDVVVEATGGTYTDEATSTTKTLGDAMQVVIASQGGSTTGVITPLTAAAYSVSKGMSGGVTSTSFSTAASNVATQFQLSGVNLATTVPVVTGTTNAYGNILRAVSQFVANGNTLSAFVSFSSPTALQAGFASAYLTINGTSVTFTFNGGSGNNGGGGSGNKNLVITVSVSGVSSMITVNNIPQPATQSDFCSGLTADTSFSQIGTAAGGTLTINSCTYSGNTGTINATLSITSPFPATIPYTITYAYQ